jgi:membrane protease YdiL (CAAX protease family)
MHSHVGGILKALGFGILAFFIVALTGGIWSAFIVINMKISPRIPWAVVAMGLTLWFGWQYLGGKWWPRTTSDARRRYLRARPVSGHLFAWAVMAGAVSVVALAGCWIVLFQLVKTPANAVPDYSSYPQLTVVLMLIMSSLVSPLSEEAGFRGYLQVALEREFGGIVAVVVSSVLFALAHLNHGLFWPKQLVYFLAGVAFGVIAFLTKSILPGIVAHIMGDLTFFIFVWPRDSSRRLVSQGGADVWFWIHAAQFVIFTALAILAFTHLARLNERVRVSAGNRDLPELV